MGWRKSTVGAVLGTLVLVACVAVPVAIARPTPLQRTEAARTLIAKIPHSRFARGRRLAMLSYARRAVRLAHGKHACAALVATDAMLSYASLPTTWHKHHVPRKLVRTPLRLLNGAEHGLLRRAGTRCARPAATHKLASHTGGPGEKVQPPNVDPEQGEGEDHPIPLGKLVMPKSIGGGSALGPDPHTLGLSPASHPMARIADDTFSFFRNSDVGVPPRTASPSEPTAAIAPAAGVVWYTGNTSDALSIDNGRTFTRFDPSSVLPDQGLAFCCDQLVSYSAAHNIFVWVSQYWCNTSCLVADPHNPQRAICNSAGVVNRIRIAVATPQALKANASNPGAAWTYWDVTPSTIGERGGEAWFDRSDMSVNPYNFNWGVDIICGGAGNLQARISLAQLAARGTVTLSYTKLGGERTVAQNQSIGTTYFTGADSDSEQQIWSWAPFSGTLFRHDINHTTVPIFNNAINGTDHNNWYDRYGIFPGEIESATVSGNTLYTAQGTGRAYCTAHCDTSTPTLHQVFNEPAVYISKYDINTWHLVGERWLWNPTLAFGWPALQTDYAGDVGIALRTSADNQNAQPVAGFLTPTEQFFIADPAGLPDETGDYYSLRPGRTNRSFVMTSEAVQNDPGGAAKHWFYIEYGLGTPPYVSPPSVQITSPANLAQFAQGATATYSASVSDPIDGTLPAAAIRWTEDGTPIGTGSTISHVETTPGSHAIRVTATNGDGKSASSAITIRVQSNGPLGATIAAPADGSVFNATQQGNQFCTNVQFRSTNSGGTVPLTFRWTDSIDQGAPQQVSTQQSPLLNLCVNGTDSQTTHDMTLTVSDGTNTATATIRVIVQFIIP